MFDFEWHILYKDKNRSIQNENKVLVFKLITMSLYGMYMVWDRLQIIV